MDKPTKIRILEKIAEVSDDIAALRKVEMEIATSGTASATLSSAGGSKSYTRMDLDKIHSLIRQKEAELQRFRCRLTGASGIRTIMFTRGGC